jgi:hypothetical protein
VPREGEEGVQDSEEEGERREVTGRGRAAPTDPQRQGTALNGLDNSHRVSSTCGVGKAKKQLSEPQGEKIREGEKDGPTKAKHQEALRRARSARWGDEATDRPSYQEANIWEKTSVGRRAY